MLPLLGFRPSPSSAPSGFTDLEDPGSWQKVTRGAQSSRWLIGEDRQQGPDVRWERPGGHEHVLSLTPPSHLSGAVEVGCGFQQSGPCVRKLEPRLAQVVLDEWSLPEDSTGAPWELIRSPLGSFYVFLALTFWKCLFVSKSAGSLPRCPQQLRLGQTEG